MDRSETWTEKMLSNLEPHLRNWGPYFARLRQEPLEDTLHEMRVVLFEKAIGQPEFLSGDKSPGYYYVVLRNHFTDLQRHEQKAAGRSELMDPYSHRFEVAAAIKPPEGEESSELLRAAWTADPQLVQELLNDQHSHQQGSCNHAKVAKTLGLSRASYYRRLNRLVRLIGLYKTEDVFSHQLALF